MHPNYENILLLVINVVISTNKNGIKRTTVILYIMKTLIKKKKIKEQTKLREVQLLLRLF
jgi:hypothetical protein